MERARERRDSQLGERASLLYELGAKRPKIGLEVGWDAILARGRMPQLARRRQGRQDERHGRGSEGVSRRVGFARQTAITSRTMGDDPRS